VVLNREKLVSNGENCKTYTVTSTTIKTKDICKSITGKNAGFKKKNPMLQTGPKQKAESVLVSFVNLRHHVSTLRSMQELQP
jgi:hypothetical protein